MPNVPKVVDRDAVRAALRDFGIELDGLRHVTFDAYTVRLTYLALNDDGRPFLIDDTPPELTYEVPIRDIRDTGGPVSAGRPVVVGGTEG